MLTVDLSIKDTLNKGRLPNEDTVCCPTNSALYKSTSELGAHLSIQDSQLGPNGVLYREAPLYTVLMHVGCNPFL